MNLVRISGLAGIWAATLGCLWLIYVLVAGPLWWLWFLAGFVTALFPALVVIGFVAMNSAMVLGGWGEDLTREVLVKAERRGLIHGKVNSVQCQGGRRGSRFDIDHIVG